MDYAISPPIERRVNTRFISTLVVFGVMLAVLIGWPAYIYFHELASRGIEMGANGVAKVDLKAISSFEFNQIQGQVEDVPADYRALDGKKVELIGEMWVKNSAAGDQTKFELVYSIAKCCFSGPPKIQHFVQSTSFDGNPLPYYQGPVRVIGTMKVDVTRDDTGTITGIYHLAVDSIEPV